MRCVGVCAFLSRTRGWRFLLLPFARNDLSKIPQMLFGTLRVADRFRSPVGFCIERENFDFHHSTDGVRHEKHLEFKGMGLACPSSRYQDLS